MKSFREQKAAESTKPADATATTAHTLLDLAGMSQEQLTALLTAEAAKAKRDGTLNADTLRAFSDQMAPMLTEEQRAKMAALLSMIGGE